MNIEIIAGSPRQESITVRIALHLQGALQERGGHAIGLVDMREHQLPMIQSVWRNKDDAPESFRVLAARMFDADAFIIVSPEYNGGYSPAMKNLFDHFPKQARKPFGICTGSYGAMGGMRASQQLLQLVPALFGIASPSMLIVPMMDKKFDTEGRLTDEPFSKSVHDFLTEFLWLAETIHAGGQPR